jgi:hypothetical protein
MLNNFFLTATPRINDTQSRRLAVSLMRGVDDSLYHWYGESAKRSENFDNDVYTKDFKNRSEANTFDSLKIYFEAKQTCLYKWT